MLLIAAERGFKTSAIYQRYNIGPSVTSKVSARGGDAMTRAISGCKSGEPGTTAVSSDLGAGQDSSNRKWPRRLPRCTAQAIAIGYRPYLSSPERITPKLRRILPDGGTRALGPALFSAASLEIFPIRR